MREKFTRYFAIKFPGMSLDTQTARDEWMTYSQGYIDGETHILELFTNNTGVMGIDQFTNQVNKYLDHRN